MELMLEQLLSLVVFLGLRLYCIILCNEPETLSKSLNLMVFGGSPLEITGNNATLIKSCMIFGNLARLHPFY